MKGNKNDIISYIKENISIQEVLQKLGGLGLERNGKEWVGQCPTGHTSKSGHSFHVIHDKSNNKNFYFCHNCGISGSAIDLVMLAKGYEFPEAINWFREHYKELEKFPKTILAHHKTEEERVKEAQLRVKSILYEYLLAEGKNLLYGSSGAEAVKYLTEVRKYEPAFLQNTEMFYLPEEKDAKQLLLHSYPEMYKQIQALKLVGHFGDNFRLAFPYRDRNGLITGLMKRASLKDGVSGKTYDGKDFVNQRFDSTPGLDKTDLFGLCKIEKKTDTLIIVEGYFDAIYLFELGLKNIVAVGQGQLSRKHIGGLEKKGIKNVIIAFDNDKVGPDNTVEAVKLLINQSDIVPFVLDPKKLGKVKDPDDYVREYGIEKFNQLLNEVEKGLVWLVSGIVEKGSQGSKLDKDMALTNAISMCHLCNSPAELDELISIISEKLSIKKNIVKEQIKAAQKQSNVQSSGRFWTLSDKNIEVNMREYIQFMTEEGYAKYYLDKDYVFVKTVDNLVTEKSLPQIKDEILTYVSNIEDDEYGTKERLIEHLYEYVNKYFNEGLIECIPARNINFRKDTANTAAVYYQNGFVLLRKDAKPEIKIYAELESPVWKHVINERTINLTPVKCRMAEFEQFLRNVTGQNEDRFLSLCSAIGYLMHDYKHDSNAKAVILCDQKISDNPNGRTGKSLIGKAIQNIKNIVRIDGKNFEFKERFTFQMVKLGTQIIDFNDVKGNFDFEKLFSVITDGMTVEYKNKTPFEIPYADSPKILISTNYTIKGEGSSFKDRMFEVEFSDHYNPIHKPKDDFGHDFFNDWDDEEWNRFDNFMLECLQLYLDMGLLGCALVNLSTRKLLDQTSAQFVEFADGNIKEGLEYNLNTLFQEFKAHIGYENDLFDKCPIKQNTFTKYLQVYAGYKGWDFIKRPSSGQQFVKLAA